MGGGRGCGFQFHKGAIRTLSRLAACDAPTYFNSIKVRLEPIADHSFEGKTVFQFHKGAIRTYADNLLAQGSAISIP